MAWTVSILNETVEEDSKNTGKGNQACFKAGEGNERITAMKTVKQIEKRWRENAEYQKAYYALEDEFAVARALIEARTKAKLTQTEVAARMETSQAAVARMEAGNGNPSLATLKRYAEATGSHLKIELQQA